MSNSDEKRSAAEYGDSADDCHFSDFMSDSDAAHDSMRTAKINNTTTKLEDLCRDVKLDNDDVEMDGNLLGSESYCSSIYGQ